MKKWIGSRLNRKLCLCFLIVSLIPLCLVYFYINSRYSEKLRSDAVVLNQLAEKKYGHTAGGLSDKDRVYFQPFL